MSHFLGSANSHLHLQIGENQQKWCRYKATRLCSDCARALQGDPGRYFSHTGSAKANGLVRFILVRRMSSTVREWLDLVISGKKCWRFSWRIVGRRRTVFVGSNPGPEYHNKRHPESILCSQSISFRLGRSHRPREKQRYRCTNLLPLENFLKEKTSKSHTQYF